MLHAIVLLIFLFAATASAAVNGTASGDLYVLDCGEHGLLMYSLALLGNTHGQVHYKRVALPEIGCDGPTLDEALLGIAPPARISIAWGAALPQNSTNLALLLTNPQVQVWAAGGNGERGPCEWPARLPEVYASVPIGSTQCSGKSSRVVHTSGCSSSEATTYAASIGQTEDGTATSLCIYGINVTALAAGCAAAAAFIAAIVGLVIALVHKAKGEEEPPPSPPATSAGV